MKASCQSPTWVVMAVATTELITTGANRTRVYSPRITSRAKTTPARGMSMAPAKAPAAPAATRIRRCSGSAPRRCPTREPMAAPMWMDGPSRPTECPEPMAKTPNRNWARALRPPSWLAP